jgi:hypothetical protein
MIEQKNADTIELSEDELVLVSGGFTLSGASGANANSAVNSASANPGQSFVGFGLATAATGAGGGNFS